MTKININYQNESKTVVYNWIVHKLNSAKLNLAKLKKLTSILFQLLVFIADAKFMSSAKATNLYRKAYISIEAAEEKKNFY